MRFIDLTGQKFGRLTVIKRLENNKRNETVWLCKCECGKEVNVTYGHLAYGHSKSCGCYAKELFVNTVSKHKLRTHRLYNIWRGIKQRCCNSKSVFFNYYGGRGIKICDEWLNDFKKFYDWSVKNGYDGKLSIDRINNDGNYEPHNCRWANPKIQSTNRRTNRIIEINGEKKCLSEWLEINNISSTTFYRRINNGWNVVEALTTPTKKNNIKKQT